MKKRRKTLRNLALVLAALLFLILVLIILDSLRNHPEYGAIYMRALPVPLTLTQA